MCHVELNLLLINSSSWHCRAVCLAHSWTVEPGVCSQLFPERWVTWSGFFQYHWCSRHQRLFLLSSAAQFFCHRTYFDKLFFFSVWGFSVLPLWGCVDFCSWSLFLSFGMFLCGKINYSSDSVLWWVLNCNLNFLLSHSKQRLTMSFQPTRPVSSFWVIYNSTYLIMIQYSSGKYIIVLLMSPLFYNHLNILLMLKWWVQF